MIEIETVKVELTQAAWCHTNRRGCSYPAFISGCTLNVGEHSFPLKCSLFYYGILNTFTSFVRSRPF